MLALTSSTTSAVALALLIALSYTYRRFSSKKAVASATVPHECEECPKYPQNLESELLKARTKATKVGTLMDLYMVHFDIYSKTWEENLLGARIINTMEARNVQQVTATAFQDWGK